MKANQNHSPNAEKAPDEAVRTFISGMLSQLIYTYIKTNRERLEAQGYRVQLEGDVIVWDEAGEIVPFASLIDIEAMMRRRRDHGEYMREMPGSPMLLAAYDIQLTLEQVSGALAWLATQSGDVMKEFSPLSMAIADMWLLGEGGMIAADGRRTYQSFYMIIRHLYIYVIIALLNNKEFSFDRVMGEILNDVECISEHSGHEETVEFFRQMRAAQRGERAVKMPTQRGEA